MGLDELGLSDLSDSLFSSDEAEFSLRAKLPLIKVWVQNINLTLGLTFSFLKS